MKLPRNTPTSRFRPRAWARAWSAAIGHFTARTSADIARLYRLGGVLAIAVGLAASLLLFLTRRASR